MQTVIDFDSLKPDQLRRLCVHFHERTEAVLAANAGLVERLNSGANASPDDTIRILNEWGEANVAIVNLSDEEVTRIITPQQSSLN